MLENRAYLLRENYFFRDMALDLALLSAQVLKKFCI
jgi:hypothetical protein